MLKKKIPLYVLPIAVIASVGLSILGYYLLLKKTPRTDEASTNTPSLSDDGCSYTIQRINGYSFIRPLMYAEPKTEAAELYPTKSSLEEIINRYKSSGQLITASVYVREFIHGNWILAGDDKAFYPGSLLKVPEVMTFFKKSEDYPMLLSVKVPYTQKLTADVNPVYVSKHIELGHTYTVGELMKYSITYSDNEAAQLLMKGIDEKMFVKLFTDLGIAAPDLKAQHLTISAKDYSQFWKVIYNASYLTINNSEKCAELLSRAEFPQGIQAGLPKGTRLIHKFGEGGPNTQPNLSETAIVYAPNHTYLITVMTEGKDMQQLASIIAELSKAAYQGMSQDNSSTESH
jgi:beta-lactamase class A